MTTRTLLAACVAGALSPALWAVPISVAGRPAPCEPAAFVADGLLMLPETFLGQQLGLAVKRGKTAGTWEISAYERTLKLRAGSTAAVANGRAVQAAQVPQVAERVLFVPADLLAQAFGLEVAPAGDGADLQMPGSAVQDVRAGSHPEYLRLVLDLSGPAPFRLTCAAGEAVLEIAPPLPATPGALRLFTFDDELSPRVKLEATPEQWTRVTVSYQGSREAQVLTLDNPCRIAVDLPRDTPLEIEPDPLEVVTPGPTTGPPPLPELPPAAATPWQVRTFTTSRGPVRVFMLKATPSAVRPALAGETIFRRARSSTICTRTGAEAAVNGGFFDTSGPPLGLLVVDGEWVKHPMMNRAALCITRDGKAQILRLGFRGSVDVAGVGGFALEGINTGHRGADSSVVYTRRWGATVAAAPGKVRLVVAPPGQVLQVALAGEAVEIPAGGFVLSAAGQCAGRLAATQAGVCATANLATTPDVPNLLHALGAGPQLVRNGQVSITAGEEQFRADVRFRACPRTAVGIHDDGNVVLVAGESADGRALTLAEMASVLQKLGCRDAMGLDGGGSTTVVAFGKVLNRPTDGSERAVSNALVVVGAGQ